MIVNLESPLVEIVSEYVVKDKDRESANELNLILTKIRSDCEEFKNLVKCLDVFLNNTNDILRRNSVKIISIVLDKIVSLNLNKQEIKKLFEFGFSKMKDVVCAPYAVKIIYCKKKIIIKFFCIQYKFS